jgi:hypothetical protein
MTATATANRVTVHLKIDRPVRQKVLGHLHLQGLTMQTFYEDLMRALAQDPARIAAVQALAQAPPDGPEARAPAS